MRLGMYSVEITRPSVEEVFSEAARLGFEEMQFDFGSVGTQQLPDEISPELTARIAAAARTSNIAITAVNGTFNMIHPDARIREAGVSRFEQIAKACSVLGCPLITLCTGSRDTQNMWRRHPGNDLPDAWSDLLHTTAELVEIAERYGVFLGVETEASNVVSSPQRARRFLDEMASPRLRIIMDPANLFHDGQARLENSYDILASAFDLLADDIIAAHGKDIREGPGISFTSAGRGIVDFDYFVGLLKSAGYRGGIIAHGIHEEWEFPGTVAYLKQVLSRANT
ncbi:sugar phosphate isomerase/epimerase family protein [Feifania hominis]|uniref:Sugar phosphate isomerase/epimerase n=1 Tax=Feifania hominis TaxID=2763660 RepID=A0A926HUW4_9FIRM|nr:sugar phosphate isomerase/epimerase [Feifania hominis]MBC8535986.1 sugar phosphate isomerase/epimerase [Feifania hominis]